MITFSGLGRRMAALDEPGFVKITLEYLRLSCDGSAVHQLPQLVAEGPDPAGVPGHHHAHDWFRHEAYLFHDLDDFLAETVPFIADGVRAGQPVMVAVTPHRLEGLRAALGLTQTG